MGLCITLLIPCSTEKNAMEPKPNAQEIYERLRSMIMSLQLMPGSRITENQLADFFNVSRTPIRAALQKLENDNLLSIKAKQGCFVRNIDMVQISHYYDVRVALENLVLVEISQLRDLSELQALAERWDPAKLFYGLDITPELKQAEEDFHQELADISRNSVLAGYIADINDHIRVVRLLGFPNEKSVIDTYEEHFRICSYLLQHNLAAAQDEMANHIRKSQDQANRVTLHQIYNNRQILKFD
ncbi:MAG TPA: GntR family transcriptional regulator [Cellvibrionaceae bacterium]|nr:GntR family transcriptional regulator [Cellvibrionaceae bacterium]HMW72216.1 GntR family transcriptional regulator [Cellvibrionaceae bacterium]